MEPSELCPLLNSNLEDIKESINKRHWDCLGINFGIEGSGKSDFSVYPCHYVDPFFSIDNCVFDYEALDHLVDSADKGSAILIDEGGEMLFSRDWNKSPNKNLIKTFFVMRQKGLFVIVNVPDIAYVDVYVRSGRLAFATRTWTYPVMAGDRMYRKRGFFSLFTRKAVLEHFKKHYYLKPAFSERYPHVMDYPEGKAFWPLYEAKKMKFLSERNKPEVDKRGTRQRVREDRLDAAKAANLFEGEIDRLFKP